MNTDTLIEALAADLETRRLDFAAFARRAIGPALVVSFAGLLIVLGLRSDLWSAVQTWRFVLKLAGVATLAASAVLLLARIARPERAPETSWLWLAAGPLMIAEGASWEISRLDPAVWGMVATGRNSLVCLAAVPLLALPMFVVLMQALRHGAPSRPATAGATAGLLSGALSALLYALQCTDDSPLFVIVWYSLGIGIMAVLGALWGRRALRW